MRTRHHSRQPQPRGERTLLRTSPSPRYKAPCTPTKSIHASAISHDRHCRYITSIPLPPPSTVRPCPLQRDGLYTPSMCPPRAGLLTRLGCRPGHGAQPVPPVRVRARNKVPSPCFPGAHAQAASRSHSMLCGELGASSLQMSETSASTLSEASASTLRAGSIRLRKGSPPLCLHRS